MAKRFGLPEVVKMKHNVHLMDEIAQRTKTPVVRNIPIDKLLPSEFQPRRDLGRLDDLADSIKENGLIEPIIVRPKNGTFEIIAGERRYRAAMQAGLKEVPCIEHDVPDNEALEISIIENIQRKDLNFFEEANSLKTLAEIYGYTHEEVAQKVSKSRVTVTELIRLNDLPEEIRERCLGMNINSKTFLLELVKLQSMEKMNEVLDHYKEQSFSREEIKKQRKLAGKKEEAGSVQKKARFKFSCDDNRFNLSVRMKTSYTREGFIDILMRLIEDIRENRIKDLPF